MNIRKTRRNAGLSRLQPASLCGKDRDHIGRIERGRQAVAASVLHRIARPGSMPAAHIIGEDGDRRA